MRTGERHGRVIAVDRARTAVTLLVVAHHAALAYATFGYLDHRHYLRSTAPIVDPDTWRLLDAVVLVNDSFFMALMFLLSGLFAWPGLRARGARAFLRDRLRRLGLPFGAAVLVLMPLAYYPSFRLAGGAAGFPAYWWHTVTAGSWPGGVAWFLWVLLVFDGVGAGLHAVASGAVEGLARRVRAGADRPVAAVAILLGVSLAAYLPLAWAFGPDRWVGLGFFAVQASRVLIYAAYFFCGLLIGAAGIDAFATRDGAFARHWPLWLASAALALAGLLLSRPGGAWTPAGALALPTCCAACCVALPAAFARFGTPVSPLDALRPQAYGLYLVHYVFVTWLQYALVGTRLPAAAKFVLVFTGAVAAGSATMAAARRLPGVARVI